MATLYTPQFFRIARSRLSDDGVFCQRIQLYQLPLAVIAGIVRNLQVVFPHVEVWLGSPHDLVVLGSPRAFAYDRAWLAALVAPGAPLAGLGQEWLGMDAPEDYFGRFLFGSRGVAELVSRGPLVHSDDRPRLEFVAARRFLDPVGPQGILDSLIRLRALEHAPDRGSPALLAKARAARPADPAALAYVDAVRRARPDAAEWAVRAAVIRLALGDRAFADSVLGRVIARGRHPGALLVAGLLATRRDQRARGRGLLRAAPSGTRSRASS